MTDKILRRKSLEEISPDEWKIILKHGAFRGYRINRLAKALQAGKFEDLIFTSNQGRVRISTVNFNFFPVNLHIIKTCRSTWSLSRISYWVKKNIFFQDQTALDTRLDFLATSIYRKIHLDCLPIEIEIERLKSCSVISSDQLNDFLDKNGSEIAEWGIKNGDEWLKFTVIMRGLLDPNEYNQLTIERLDKLDGIITKFLGIEDHYVAPFFSNESSNLTSLPMDILNQITSRVSADDLKSSVRQMKMLYQAKAGDKNVICENIQVKKFAEWVRNNHISLLIAFKIQII